MQGTYIVKHKVTIPSVAKGQGWGIQVHLPLPFMKYHAKISYCLSERRSSLCLRRISMFVACALFWQSVCCCLLKHCWLSGCANYACPPKLICSAEVPIISQWLQSNVPKFFPISSSADNFFYFFAPFLSAQGTILQAFFNCCHASSHLGYRVLSDAMGR